MLFDRLLRPGFCLIFVTSMGYDEPKILRYDYPVKCPTVADGLQMLRIDPAAAARFICLKEANYRAVMSGKNSKSAASNSRIFGVFQANKGLIASVLRRYSLSRIDIADITQETILRALEAENRTEIREPQRFLIGIAKNIARTEIERRSKMTLDLLDEFDPQSYISDDPPVDEAVDIRRRMRVFWEAVATLPPQCQKVFVLKHVYGASHKEIARKLDIAVSTVEKHVALGLRRCRESMLNKLSGDESQGADDSVLGLEIRGR